MARDAWTCVCVTALLAACPPRGAPSAVDVAVAPPARAALIEQLAGPSAIALDERFVYWAERVSGDVRRVPRGGGAPETVAATGFTELDMLAVGGGYVYWVSTRDSGLYRLASASPRADGGAATRVATCGVGTGLAADAAHVYRACGVVARIRHDGAPEARWPAAGTTADAGAPDAMESGTQLALGPTHACWRSGGRVRCAATAGGVARTVLDGLGREADLALTRTYVYLCDVDSNALVRARLDGAGADPEPVDASCGVGSRLAATGDAVYRVSVSGMVDRFRDGRAGLDVMGLGFSSANTNHVSVALDGGAAYLAVDAAWITGATGVIDLTGRTQAPSLGVAWRGSITRFALAAEPDATRPAETTLFGAWLDAETDEALDRVDRGWISPALNRGVARGVVAVRLVSPNAALLERTLARFRQRVAPRLGASARVLPDPRPGTPQGAGQVRVVFDLGELARAFAP